MLGNIAINNSRAVIASFECEMQIIHFCTIWHATGTLEHSKQHP